MAVVVLCRKAWTIIDGNMNTSLYQKIQSSVSDVKSSQLVRWHGSSALQGARLDPELTVWACLSCLCEVPLGFLISFHPLKNMQVVVLDKMYWVCIVACNGLESNKRCIPPAYLVLPG